MRKNITIHLIVSFILIGVFFLLGWVDKSRFDKASVDHKPQLLFAHEKIIIQDGGSVIWSSFMYDAFESRRMEVTRISKDSKDEVKIHDGFQGTRWSWKPHNLLWVLLLVSLSFIYRHRKSREQ